MEAYPEEKDFGLKDRMLRITNHTNPFASDEFNSFMWKYDFSASAMTYPFFNGCKSCDIVIDEHRNFFEKLASEHFDLIFTDSLFAVCAYGFTSLNKAKHVIIDSTHVDSSTGSMRAFGMFVRNWALTPPSYMPVGDAEFKPELFRYRMYSLYEWIVNFLVSGIIVNERMKMSLSSVAPSFR
ncbi:unnamed protein product [Strongylus vulgaris]|uniref:Uncharacterized protein n=1 Tax=Strongylus vulgaris TaxID=40348 RepID=A0A3P7JHP8_STRVU|nr:unnamed protein product [Strongylus vulgaris]